jgi:hypothetical protein
LLDDDGVIRLKAVEAIRSLIGKITLSPEEGKLAIEVHGDLAGILTVAARGRNTATRLLGVAEKARVEKIISRVEMVAGARSKHNCASQERRSNIIVDIGLWEFTFGTPAIPVFEQTADSAIVLH